MREPDEHARERIAGARLAPLSRFDPEGLAAEPGKFLVFHCNSGNRTTQRLLRAGEREVYQLAGGLQAWKRAGLPVIGDRKAPLPIMRQVQITAGRWCCSASYWRYSSRPGSWRSPPSSAQA